MKVTMIGCKRIQGTGKESGLPFDMCHVYVVVPVDVGQGKVTVTGYGFEVAEMELSPDAMSQFAGLKFPCELELKVDQRFFRGEFRSMVSGIENQVAAAVRKVG